MLLAGMRRRLLGNRLSQLFQGGTLGHGDAFVRHAKGSADLPEGLLRATTQSKASLENVPLAVTEPRHGLLGKLDGLRVG